MEFSHINREGYARMVDVSEKKDTARIAVAHATICMEPATLKSIKEGAVKKGDVLSVAQVAGIMAAKQTGNIIPMCHPLMLTGVDISFVFDEDNSMILIEAEVKTTGKTGVEMEAIAAVTVAAMTIYDMAKAVDRWMTITDIKLIEKAGGKSGHWTRENRG